MNIFTAGNRVKFDPERMPSVARDILGIDPNTVYIVSSVESHYNGKFGLIRLQGLRDDVMFDRDWFVKI